MPDPAPPNAEEPDRFQRFFPVAWFLFQLTTWVLVGLLFAPGDFYRLVGADGVAHWLRYHGWVRWATFPIWGPLLLFSVFQLRSVGRASEAEPGSDTADGSLGAIDLALGMRDGAPTRWELEGYAVEAATWSKEGERRCVAITNVASSSGFAFSVRPSRQEPAWMRGAAQAAFRVGMDRVKGSMTGAQAQTWNEMAFLGQDPVNLGGGLHAPDFVLRASQPEMGRELISSGDVGRVISELERAGRNWEWSLLPTGRPGEACLRFECRGKLENPQVAAWARELMSAGLRWLTRAGATPKPADQFGAEPLSSRAMRSAASARTQ
jgi:hypothetical protein